MFQCFIKVGLQQFIISKYERILRVKEYNRSYFNKNVWFYSFIQKTKIQLYKYFKPFHQFSVYINCTLYQI